MVRPYREHSYLAPLDPPLETQAHIAPSDGDWRLIVFPGTPCRKYLFDRFMPRAPRDLEVVLLMRPGYGRRHDRPYLSFNDQIAAARPFLEDGKKVVTLGVSYGGALALKALLDHPHVVKGAVTVAALVTEPRPYVQPFADLGGAFGVRHVLPRHLHHARAELEGRRAQVGPLFARLRDERRPVSILHGDADHLVPLSDAQTLQGYFGPNADVAFDLVKGGTHFLEMQTPQRLYDAVASVIGRAQRRA